MILKLLSLLKVDYVSKKDDRLQAAITQKPIGLRMYNLKGTAFWLPYQTDNFWKKFSWKSIIFLKKNGIDISQLPNAYATLFLKKIWYICLK